MTVDPVVTDGPIRRYLMAVIMVAVTVVQVVIGAVTDGIATDEWLQIAVSLAGAVAVWLVPNFPRWPWLKTAIGAILVGLNLAQQLIAGGVTPEEWYMIAVAVVGALGLIVAPKPITQRT